MIDDLCALAELIWVYNITKNFQLHINILNKVICIKKFKIRKYTQMRLLEKLIVNSVVLMLYGSPL